MSCNSTLMIVPEDVNVAMAQAAPVSREETPGN